MNPYPHENLPQDKRYAAYDAAVDTDDSDEEGRSLEQENNDEWALDPEAPRPGHMAEDEDEEDLDLPLIS